ncbi:glycosyltransferase family 2 protein [Leptospira bourretii]|uniref:Glycosyltransferase family 2 protein n=1 Tax=Leptospira bourretii TaxID=2484962 RepID=A0A4R9IJQ3_9LEPT|nr:glycosyltransferase family 2 protein [Leptospira bourretii]TGK79454.1 glycosyltransferase family 2 protein [Leptospira bourretii]TGK89663.1 glycosyltransferase family 2 protein [Leptospira bourretii]TGL19575.1 glycosyltransferase family 2 protein [Leptospira bourretii]TGL33621.1 glycosyltransferase family 2 protein [Leptospira bourretii]
MALPKAKKKATGTPKSLISLIIPIYNEAAHLEEFLSRIDKLSLPADKELVFVDDCSKDKSFSILGKFSFRTNHVKILQQPENQGKGAALRRGIQEASGDIILVQDADFEYDMDEIHMLVNPILINKADVVFGSRFKKDGRQVHRTFHYLVNRFLTILSNFLSGLYLTDMETCYKVFRSDIIQNINLESNRFGFEPEITAKLARLKIRVQEFPISYYPRNYLEGKKITWKDGIAALRHIFYFNLFASKVSFFKNEMPDHYIPKSANWL